MRNTERISVIPHNHKENSGSAFEKTLEKTSERHLGTIFVFRIQGGIPDTSQASLPKINWKKPCRNSYINLKKSPVEIKLQHQSEKFRAEEKDRRTVFVKKMSLLLLALTFLVCFCEVKMPYRL